MRKENMVEVLSGKFSNVSKRTISGIVNEFIEIIKKEMMNDTVIELRGFGTFYVKVREEKKARNPKTGEPVSVPKRKVPVFKPGIVMKKMINTGKYIRVSKKRKPAE